MARKILTIGGALLFILGICMVLVGLFPPMYTPESNILGFFIVGGFLIFMGIAHVVPGITERPIPIVNTVALVIDVLLILGAIIVAIQSRTWKSFAGMFIFVLLMAILANELADVSGTDIGGFFD